MEHRQWAPVAQFLEAEIGYAIPESKYYLLDTHLGKMLDDTCRTPVQLVESAKRSLGLRQQLIEGATINESFFFRDVSLWAALEKRVLPELADAVSFCNEVHVLMCACSRGQEVYSLAMLLAESPLFAQRIRVSITAADIDATVLNYARAGRYSQLEASRGLDEARRRRWFIADGQHLRIDPKLQDMITWQPLNLANDFTFMRRFDLVFCRNVLIYFDGERKPAILRRLAQYTNNHGFLVLGGAESAFGFGDAWRARAIENYTFYEKVY